MWLVPQMLNGNMKTTWHYSIFVHVVCLVEVYITKYWMWPIIISLIFFSETAMRRWMYLITALQYIKPPKNMDDENCIFFFSTFIHYHPSLSSLLAFSVIYVTPKEKGGTTLWKLKMSYGYQMMQLGIIYQMLFTEWDYLNYRQNYSRFRLVNTI